MAEKWYIKTYDPWTDDIFQCEVDYETMRKAIAHETEVRDTPWPDVPIKSRFRSEREAKNARSR